MENLFKQGSGILLGFLYFALGSIYIEVVTAKEFNTTKDIHVKIWNNNIPINSNGLMFVRVSTRNLQINCSIPSGSKKPINIGWKKGQNWLDGRSVDLLTSNNYSTLRLTIDVTWDLNGSIYWCGPKDGNIFDTSVKGSHVTIITGDPPRPPIDIRHDIVGLKLYQINIKWKAPSNVGRLPTYYNVTYKPCFNKTYCQGTPRYKFCTIPHVIGKVNYKCSKLREEMESLDYMCDLYRVTIATVNPLGESKSPEFVIDVDFGGPNKASYPTPRPPLSLSVSSIDSNTIEIQWTARELWNIVDNIRYTILYHKDKDHTNKTVVMHKGQTLRTLRKADGIEPFTKYYIYITVEFNKSGVSEPLGPKIIRTPEGTPDPGPDIFNTSSSRYLHNTTMRNVTITWKVPPLSAWHGKPSYIKINYRNANDQDFKEKHISAIPNPPRQAVLTGLDSTVSYTSSVALCNSKRCGDTGQTKEIEPIKGSNKAETTDFTNSLKYTLIGICIPVSMMILLAVLAYFYFSNRNSKIKGTQLSLEQKIGDLESDYEGRYQDVNRLSYSLEYAKPNI